MEVYWIEVRFNGQMSSIAKQVVSAASDMPLAKDATNKNSYTNYICVLN